MQCMLRAPLQQRVVIKRQDRVETGKEPFLLSL